MGALSRDLYRILEKESENYYELENEKKRNSLYNQAIGSLFRMIGINPFLGKLGLIGGSRFATTLNLGDKIADKMHLQGASAEGITAAIATPYMLSRLQNIADTKNLKTEANYFIGGNNFADYTTGKQAQHFARVVNKALTAGAFTASAGLIGAGKGAAATALMGNASASLLAGKGGAALTGLIGASTGGIGAMILPAIGAMVARSFANNLINGNLANKKGKLTVVTPNAPGVMDLMGASTYRRHAQMLQMLVAQGALSPAESAQLSVLNDINLNTSALIPLYSKFLSNHKQVASDNVANNLIDLFGPNEKDERWSESEERYLTKNQLNLRKASFKILQKAELGITDFMYQAAAPLMLALTGKSFQDFRAEKADILGVGENAKLFKHQEQAAKSLNVPANLFTATQTDASRWLQAPDYESRMLGLTANIHELMRGTTLSLFDIRAGIVGSGNDLGSKKSAFNLVDYLNKKDPIEEKDPEIGLFQNMVGLPGKFVDDTVEALPTFFNRSFNSFSDFIGLRQLSRYLGSVEKEGTLGNIARFLGSKVTDDDLTLSEGIVDIAKRDFENIKSFSLKDKFLDILGVKDFDTVQKEYESQKKEIENFNVQKSANEYLGKYFPDHMQEIIHQLKQQTQFLSDLLRAKGIQGTILEKSDKKWRGAFGEFADDESYGKKLAAYAYKNTREALGLGKRKLGSFFGSTPEEREGATLGFIGKLLGLNDEDYNSDNKALKELMDSDVKLAKSKKKSKLGSMVGGLFGTKAGSIDDRQEFQKKQDIEEKKLQAFFNMAEHVEDIRNLLKCSNNYYGISCGAGGIVANNINYMKHQRGLMTGTDGMSDDGDFIWADTPGGDKKKTKTQKNKTKKPKSKWGRFKDFTKKAGSKIWGFTKGIGGRVAGMAIGAWSLFGGGVTEAQATTVSEKAPKTTKVPKGKPEKPGILKAVWAKFKKLAPKKFGKMVVKRLSMMGTTLLASLATGPGAIITAIINMGLAAYTAYEIASFLWELYKETKAEIDEVENQKKLLSSEISNKDFVEALDNSKKFEFLHEDNLFSADNVDLSEENVYKLLKSNDPEAQKIARQILSRGLGDKEGRRELSAGMQLREFAATNAQFKQKWDAMTPEEMRKATELYSKDKEAFMQQYVEHTKAAAESSQATTMLTGQVVELLNSLNQGIKALLQVNQQNISIDSAMLAQLSQLKINTLDTVKPRQ